MLLEYPSLSDFRKRVFVGSAAPKIWRVSRSAARETWKFGRSGTSGSASSAAGSGSGRVQLNVVKRALSRKTIPGTVSESNRKLARQRTLHNTGFLNSESYAFRTDLDLCLGSKTNAIEQLEELSCRAGNGFEDGWAIHLANGRHGAGRMCKDCI